MLTRVLTKGIDFRTLALAFGLSIVIVALSVLVQALRNRVARSSSPPAASRAIALLPSDTQSAALALDTLKSSWAKQAVVEMSADKCCPIFSHIMRLHGDRRWGSVLDAGTGSHSLSWLRGLHTERIVAVTGDERMKRSVERDVSLRPGIDSVVVGNWAEEGFLKGQRFDYVLADYLLGAMDGLAPYFQHRLMERLAPHIGKRLYFIGLEPFPESSSSPNGQLMIDVARTRDACILLASQRPYREYPSGYVLTHLQRAGYRIESFTTIASNYSKDFVVRQIGVGELKLPLWTDTPLRAAMYDYLSELRRRAAALKWPFQFGSDYVIAAVPPNADA